MAKNPQDSAPVRLSWIHRIQEKTRRVWQIELDFPRHVLTRYSLFFIFLLSLIVGSSLSVVYSAHYSRGLFHELKMKKQERDALETEWGQLLLEQSALSAHTRVEQVAVKYLNLALPKAKDVELVMSNGR
ncbi:cell division protein FtsL [Litoribacillus peritrichatus]|uniref:Cell division protein FtsL n=1 Tax=Litoribacillus peritrichatus TaxID=718191 RepID=A0ABP7M066_9GAMM